MKKTLRLLTFLVLAAALVAPDAEAQFRIGPRAGYDLDVKNAYIGAEARFGLQQLDFPISINPYADYFLVDSNVDEVLDVEIDQRLIAVGANALFEIDWNMETFSPYAGAGVNVAYSAVETTQNNVTVESSTTDIGLNLLAGTYIGTGTMRPFAQARYTALSDRNFFTLTGGVLFQFGGQ